MDEVAARYRSFIDNEVAGSSEIYRDWADGIIEDADIRARLAVLPVRKQQPNSCSRGHRWR